MAKESDFFAKDVVKIQFGILLITLVSLVSSLDPRWKLWGLDSLAAFPVTMRVTLVLFLLLSLAPRVQQTIGRKLAELTANFSGRAVAFYYFITAAVLLGIFVLLPSNNHLLGDGYQVLGDLAYGQSRAPFEFLTNFLIRAVYGLTEGGESGALLTYRIWAFIAGTVFLASLWFFLKNKTDIWIMLAVSLTFGAMQFFAGYVERYTLSFLFVFLYVMSAQKDLQTKRFSSLTVVLLLLAITFHLQVGVLIPSLLYLAYVRWHTRTVLLIGILISLSLLVAAVIYTGSSTQLSQVALPLSATAESPYHLFCSEHLTDLMNLILLNYPILVAVLATVSLWRLRFGIFHILTITPTLAFTLLIDPKLGAIRDWDLLSLASAPIMVTIFAMSQSPGASRQHLYRLLIPVLLFAVMHTGSWLWLNSSASRSYNHLKAIVREDLHYSAGYHEGYRNRSWAQLVRTYYADTTETIRSLEIRVQAKPDDEGSRYVLAKSYSLFLKDDTTAARLVAGYWQHLLNQPEVIKDIAIMLFKGHYHDEAERMLDSLLATGFKDVQVFSGLAILKESKQNYEQAWMLYKNSLDIQMEPPISNRLGFAVFSIQHGHVEEGTARLQAVTPSLPEPNQSTARSLLAALARNDQKQIDSLCAILRPTS